MEQQSWVTPAVASVRGQLTVEIEECPMLVAGCWLLGTILACAQRTLQAGVEAVMDGGRGELRSSRPKLPRFQPLYTRPSMDVNPTFIAYSAKRENNKSNWRNSRYRHFSQNVFLAQALPLRMIQKEKRTTLQVVARNHPRFLRAT